MLAKIANLFFSWLLFSLGAIEAYANNLVGIFTLFFFFFLADFVTGLLASWRKGEKFTSAKARWSFAKSFCYLGSFAVIIFIGVSINQMPEFMNILKVVVWAAIWFEAVSNTENMESMFPESKFIKFLHYMLAVEWVKKIPMLSDFLKEEKIK
jgi:hypothetical protein